MDKLQALYEGGSLVRLQWLRAADVHPAALLDACGTPVPTLASIPDSPVRAHSMPVAKLLFRMLSEASLTGSKGAVKCSSDRA